MPQTKGQSSEEVNDAGLDNLGTFGRDPLNTIFDKINTNLDSPLRLSASYPTPDAKLNFSSSSLVQADGASAVMSPISKQVFPLLATPFINFQLQTVSNAPDFDITWPSPCVVGQFRRVGFTLTAAGKIKVLFSPEAATQVALPNAGTLVISSGTGIGYIDLICTSTSGLFKTARSVTSVIENADISRFSASGGSGSGSSTGSGGGELADLPYAGKVLEVFNTPDGTTSVDISAGKTDVSLYDSSTGLFRLAYDAGKTVTGTALVMVLSSAPAFTIKKGDMLVVNSEARAVNVVTSQTVFTIESAFSVNPATATCCISQTVHTVDLNNYTNGGLSFSVASQYAGNIDEIMYGYWDSATLGDIIPDFGLAPVIALTASTDLTNWTTTRTRVTSLSQSVTPVTCTTSNPNLYLRFFANKTSGSGFVNLLRYKVFFQKLLSQTAGALYYTAFARPTSSIAQNCTVSLVGGKTRFAFTFPYTRGLNSGEASGSVLEVIANGQIIARYTAGVTDNAQAYFNEINDNTIEMDTDYSTSGIDFQFKVQRVGIIDTNSLNTNKIALHDDLLDQSIDAQVIPSWLTAVNAAPTLLQFRSDITGRASIPDLSAMLSVQMGPQRIMTQEIYQLQTEFGPSGQPVFGVVNDKFNQIRYVGAWASFNDTDGCYIKSTVIGDYTEYVFWGTGLNICFDADDSGIALNYSIDGGSPVAITIPTYSAILGARNYAANQILNIAKGLGLGLHTIKVINNATVELKLQGFEVLTETTSLMVMPGTIVKGKYKNILNAMQTVAYDSNFESGTLGTKGGCVLVYIKNDGTIGKALTPTDVTPLYLTASSHANEEMVRAHNFREFGAGRSDDFSLTFTPSNRTFTLDDGVTNLTGSTVSITTISGIDYLYLQANGSFFTLTFIGTGLDFIQIDSASGGADSYTVSIDGAIAIALPAAGVTSSRNVKICSGLPYGTHTVKVSRISGATWALCVSQFIIYAPKKPTLPVGSIEQAQFYKVANYVANTTASVLNIAQGVLRKMSSREFVFVGAGFSTGLDILSCSSMNTQTSTVGNYAIVSFFGTGFDWKLTTNTISYSCSISIDGSTNLSAYGTAFYGQVASFTAATGVLVTSAANGYGSGVAVTGLALGWHTLVITKTAGANATYYDAIDVITPIHAPTINGPYVLQNTLSLGNNNFLDLRKFNKRDIPLSTISRVSQSYGVGSQSFSANVPGVDMSITHQNTTGKIRINYVMSVTSASTPYVIVQIYIDGVARGAAKMQTNIASNFVNVGDLGVFNVSPGVHKIDIYLASSGTSSVYGVQRNITVEDI